MGELPHAAPGGVSARGWHAQAAGGGRASALGERVAVGFRVGGGDGGGGAGRSSGVGVGG